MPVMMATIFLSNDKKACPDLTGVDKEKYGRVMLPKIFIFCATL